MVTQVTLPVEPRSETGKGAARSLRRQGYIPAVVYGHGEETQELKVDTAELEKLLTTVSYESTLINLKFDDEDEPARALIREVQVHPFKPEVLHVDFLLVHKGEKIRLELPIHLVGEAPGVKEGAILERLRHELEVRVDPDAIPEALEADVSELEIGDSLTIEDLEIPEGVEVLDDPDTTICAVVVPAIPTIEEEEAAAAAAEEEALLAEEGELEEGVEVEGEAEEGEPGEPSEEAPEDEEER